MVLQSRHVPPQGPRTLAASPLTSHMTHTQRRRDNGNRLTAATHHHRSSVPPPQDPRSRSRSPTVSARHTVYLRGAVHTVYSVHSAHPSIRKLRVRRGVRVAHGVNHQTTPRRRLDLGLSNA